jgi:hypothetical protein
MPDAKSEPEFISFEKDLTIMESGNEALFIM